MVELAILIGIFSYLIFGLGLVGGLGKLGILGVAFSGSLLFLSIKKNTWERLGNFWQKIRNDKISFLLLSLFVCQMLVNLIGALGPELGFDALWYHLTLPKIYIEQGRILFIPGNLFYYSAMPRLTEMFYLLSLPFSPMGILAKIVHFSFGVLSAVALYHLARRYLNFRWAILTAVIFYSTLIVGWQSITAYVDLARTFFEILALDLFLKWYEKNPASSRQPAGLRGASKILLVESAIMLGLAISTKLIAFASLPFFLILILLRSRKIKFAIGYLLFAIIIPFPWFAFAFIHTGNPVYPIFSGILDASHTMVLPNPLRMVQDFWQLFFRPPDPISPIFLIFLPVMLGVLVKGKLKVWLRVLSAYVLGTWFFWYLTPRTGGARFILPYLPALCLLFTGAMVQKEKWWRRVFVLVVLLVAMINLGYRSLANKKFLPIILGQESTEKFLSKNLNFNFGDFYDKEGEIKKIVGDKLVLVYGGHNLFYADFPFVHSSYRRPEDPVCFVLVQGKDLPPSISLGKVIYNNSATGVRLFLYSPPNI